MRVEAFPLDKGWKRALPEAISDGRGQFAIRVPVERWTGRSWLVYPHDESHYYPELSKRFYRRTGDGGEVAQLRGPDAEARVEVRLGREAGVLKAEVTDVETGRLLESKCRLAWARDESRQMEEQTAGGLMTVLLPSRTAIRLTVTAPGYQAWSYPGAIELRAGEKMLLDVHLRKAAGGGRR